MGLDISHNTWHGAYSSFMRWRQEIAKIAGYPPLMLMEGFYADDVFAVLEYHFPRGDELEMWRFRETKKEFPIKWDNFKDDPLIELLRHSDCDGQIKWQNCLGIANRLKSIINKLPVEDDNGHIGNWRDKTKTFINGCLLAHKEKKNLKFQ